MKSQDPGLCWVTERLEELLVPPKDLPRQLHGDSELIEVPGRLEARVEQPLPLHPEVLYGVHVRGRARPVKDRNVLLLEPLHRLTWLVISEHLISMQILKLATWVALQSAQRTLYYRLEFKNRLQQLHKTLFQTVFKRGQSLNDCIIGAFKSGC